MVSLCGCVISNRFYSLVEHDSLILPYRNWRSIPIEVLYDEITGYNTFSSMIKSLCRPEAKAAVTLLRSDFAGFLDVVTVLCSDCGLVDFLTAQGVLLKPDAVRPHYRMASPLIDGLIRTRVIPVQFPNAPTIPPIQSDGKVLRVLDTLIESIKFFDKDLIR